MASITITAGHKNLIFAALVASETSATFEETGNYITITDSPELAIPRYCFRQTFDPDGQRASRGDGRLERAWRSLLLNKQGFLVYFGDSEIIIADEKPSKRPQFLLRFPDVETKVRTEEWAGRAGFGSVTDFILKAIEAHCAYFERQAQ